MLDCRCFENRTASILSEVAVSDPECYAGAVAGHAISSSVSIVDSNTGSVIRVPSHGQFELYGSTMSVDSSVSTTGDALST